jgi:hypothetical protein
MIAGGYGDALRALGRFLDSVGACEIGIVERGDDLFISWSDRGPMRYERRFQPADVASLQASARLYRGLTGRSQRFTNQEFLRTLGIMLDELEATSMSITETADGFRLTAHIGDGPTTASNYSYADLVLRAQRYFRPHAAPSPNRNVAGT